jgi:outer membrane protein assembly factor BamB
LLRPHDRSRVGQRHRVVVGGERRSGRHLGRGHEQRHNSGHNPNETTIGMSNVWSLFNNGQGPAGAYSYPEVANEVVYVGSDDGKVYAFGLR